MLTYYSLYWAMSTFSSSTLQASIVLIRRYISSSWLSCLCTECSFTWDSLDPFLTCSRCSPLCWLTSEHSSCFIPFWFLCSHRSLLFVRVCPSMKELMSTNTLLTFQQSSFLPSDFLLVILTSVEQQQMEWMILEPSYFSSFGAWWSSLQIWSSWTLSLLRFATLIKKCWTPSICRWRKRDSLLFKSHKMFWEVVPRIKDGLPNSLSPKSKKFEIKIKDNH